MMKLTFLFVLVAVAGAYGKDTPVGDDFDTTTINDGTTPDDTTTTTTTQSTTIATTTPSTTTSEQTTIPATTTISPAPNPITDHFFVVTENNVTCIMYSGLIQMKVTYPNEDGKTSTATVKVPKPDDSEKKNVVVTGSCNVTDLEVQFIKISWGTTNKLSSMELMFNSTGDKWMFVDAQFNIFMDETVFPNSTEAGSFLNVVGSFPGLSDVSIEKNRSLVCRADIKGSNFTATVANSSNSYTAAGSAVGVKLQAYNSVPNTTELQHSSRCEADMTSDLVPIAVGCALAGLVLLVLITYLVGRRRRSAAYQSV